jgi:hypothetical protein
VPCQGQLTALPAERGALEAANQHILKLPFPPKKKNRGY